MEEFLNQNSSAVFALLGALGGGLLSFLGSWLLTKRNYSLRVWDKLVERRIEAHENVIAIALEMRIMVSLGEVEKDGEVARAPKVLMSKEDFEDWFGRFSDLVGKSSTWLTTETRREVNFVQDYFVTLHMNLRDATTESYSRVGQAIRDDFIRLSAQLEETAFRFFEGEVQSLKVSNLREWHKYQLSETKKRLQETVLLSQWESISGNLHHAENP